MDESPRQLIDKVKTPIPGAPGRPARYDYEYRRNGVANIFMMFEPLAGKREVEVTARRANEDFARCMCKLTDEIHPQAQKIIVVMDNLSTHKKSALYEVFAPAEAKRIADRLDIHYTPRHGSWLNMAEIEISVLSRQCLAERMDNLALLESEINAWQKKRNMTASKVDWRFTTDNARIKLKRLYPSLQK